MDKTQNKMYRCKKQGKLECSTMNMRSVNWETNCMGNKRKNLSPQELCRCLKYKSPPPPGCINNYPKKKRKKKTRTSNGAETVQPKLDKEQSKNGTESNTDASTNQPATNSNVNTSITNVNTNKTNENTSATSTEWSRTKKTNTEITSKSNTNSSTTTSKQQNSNEQTTQKSSSSDTSDSERKQVCFEVQNIKEVEYIEYKGIGKRRRHRNDYMTGPPLPVILDTTPNYYAKVDAQKTTCEFYCNYLNCKLWKEHLPKPPILIGADIHHLHCFVNEEDYLYKYLKQKQELEQKNKCRDKKK